ncbi:MAG: inositol phosphorylceramide synthase [Chitinophagaceae bacterium]|nr:inositol phosphorylceramide synthase [Chitinophagaceae bacterium]
MSYRNSNFYSSKSIFSAAAATAIYLFVSYWLIGFKTDQLFLAGVFNVFYFFTPTSRKFILGFAIFIVYWIIFDYMKAFPNYRFNAVHIQDLYDAEKSWFGMSDNGATITPNEFWIKHQQQFLDIMTGIFYLCWIPVPLAFAGWLFFKDKKIFLQFSLTFVFVNFIGFVIYYLYPAAPPWYIQLHGNVFIAHTPGNTAGLGRFDQYFNAGIFKSLYAKSSNVFAAMPSLHSSYPLVVLYYGIKKGMGIVTNGIFAIVMLGIWFAAVYTSHHYLLDVIAGVVCAVIAILVFQKVLLRNNFFNYLLNRFLKKIS